jgi:tetratricopeptide (TPR) repeat protein
MRFDEATVLKLVDALDRSGRKNDAMNTLALFLSQNPANVSALRLAGHWQIASGQWDAAIATLEGLRARVGNRDAALLAELGFAYLGKGDADEAEAYAAAAYRLAPSNPAAASAWGVALLELGDAERAGQLLEKSASIAPATASLRWHLSQAYVALGRKKDAISQARAALLDPSFTERQAAQNFLKSVA